MVTEKVKEFGSKLTTSLPCAYRADCLCVVCECFHGSEHSSG